MSSNSTLGADDHVNLPHDSKGSEALEICWTLHAVATLFLCLRLFCKIIKRKQLWWDDYILVLSWALSIAGMGFYTPEIRLGLGSHIWDVDVGNIVQLNILGACAFSLSVIGTAGVKTSFGLTLLRLTDGRLRYLIIFFFVSTDLLICLMVFASWFRCTPIEKCWNPFLVGECSKILTIDIGVAATVYSGIIDVMLAIVPWAILWNHRMRKSEKIGVAVAMSMGLMSVNIFLGGITAFVKASKIQTLGGEDITYDLIDLCIWGNVEPTVTIIAVCIPALRVLVRDITTTENRPTVKTSWDRVSIPSAT